MLQTPILDFTEANGLVLCNEASNAQNEYERLYLSEAKKLEAHSVFFRRLFSINSDLPYKSEPSVVIFEEEKIPVNSNKHKVIHAALWSEGKADVYIIYGKTVFDIYTAKQPADKDDDGGVLISEQLRLASRVKGELDISRFSARLFGTGTFWEQKENQSAIKLERSPYNHLVDYLMKVRWSFIESHQNSLQSSTIDKILVLSILVKFLEDKKDTDTEKSTLDDIYLKHGIANIEQAVRFSKFIEVLEELANEFNGKVFDQFTEEEKNQIKQSDLGLLSDFLSARIDIAKKQLFLWEQYSFKHLPAEVISAIYENFIQEETKRKFDGARDKGVVYTPVHLVNFLVDEAMPLDKPAKSFIEKGDFKVLDPTCGSGVFLVAAYKRLLQWWAIAESEKAGEIIYPDKDTAQKILEDNIYGVDVKDTAVFVTIFGLTTALLDFLTPKEVWGNLKFKDLSQNNVVQGKGKSGFFSWALGAKKENRSFSLVIGNPPFNPEKGVSKNEVLLPELIDQLDLKHKDIPRGNFALHFFEASMSLADNVCMIIPSNVLLYDKSANDYRKNLFTDYSISEIFDFTHLRESLFVKKGGGKKTGRTPVIALLGENKPSEFNAINHTVVKRAISVEQKIRFEIDHYDRHTVKWEWAVDPDKQFVWKTNLLGGGRLFHLISRLDNYDKLQDVIHPKGAKRNEWLFQDGYKNLSEKPISPVIDYLYDQDRVEGIDSNGKLIISGKVDTKYFGRPRPRRLYQPPFVLVHKKTGGGKFPVGIIDKYAKPYLAFSNSFIGIKPTDDQIHLLKEIFSDLMESNSVALFWMITTSSNTLVSQETTINKEDLAGLPIGLSKRRFSDYEKVLIGDVLKYYIHFGKSISKGSDGAVLHLPVQEKQLFAYGETLCSELNDIYAKNTNSWQIGKVCQMPSYTVFQIGFGKDKSLKHEFVKNNLDEDTRSLINNDVSNSGAAYKRISRLYTHTDGFDCVYFIKPNAIRYWLKSIALRDADEAFADFRRGGF